ncbi:hypothetical protein CW304_33105 [Bacillus sp. UFRGS-B20]|nr:hypothetical protein CW304_33105 [Bacillus sp. UFRGS-B20]
MLSSLSPLTACSFPALLLPSLSLLCPSRGRRLLNSLKCCASGSSALLPSLPVNGSRRPIRWRCRLIVIFAGGNSRKPKRWPRGCLSNTLPAWVHVLRVRMP